MQYKMSRSVLLNLFLVLTINLFVCAQNDIVSTILDNSLQFFTDKNKTVCYDKFGCYSLAFPWTSDQRQVSVFPQSPEKVNPTYCLLTRRNPDVCDNLEIDNPPSVFQSNFVAGGQVYFIAHGFLENGNKTWIKQLTVELLKRLNGNVIIINWAGGSNPPYAQAVANIRLVGVMTTHLIKMMSDEVGLKPEKTHVIGHSLGAHLSSYIGTNLRRMYGLRLGRITGLDPAEPHFSGTDNIVRLDPTDAIFVDNIHTDGKFFITGSLGMRDPVGHVDFYPNGGKDQPGCPDKFGSGTLDGIEVLRKIVGCNHIRSYQYFIETINSPDKNMAVECKSWEAYLNGTCFRCDYNPIFRNGTQCAQFGFHSIRAFSRYRLTKTKVQRHNDLMLEESPKRRHIQMYLITGPASPYLRNQYRVSWKVWDQMDEYGKFRINIIGLKGETGLIELNKYRKHFEKGSEHQVVIASANVGHLLSAKMEWAYDSSLFNLFSWRFNPKPMGISHVTIESLETKESITLCQTDNTTLASGFPKDLTLCVK